MHSEINAAQLMMIAWTIATLILTMHSEINDIQLRLLYCPNSCIPLLNRPSLPLSVGHMGNESASAEYTISSARNANASGQKLSELMEAFFAGVCLAG